MSRKAKQQLLNYRAASQSHSTIFVETNFGIRSYIKAMTHRNSWTYVAAANIKHCYLHIRLSDIIFEAVVFLLAENEI